MGDFLHFLASIPWPIWLGGVALFIYLTIWKPNADRLARLEHLRDNNPAEYEKRMERRRAGDPDWWR